MGHCPQSNHHCGNRYCGGLRFQFLQVAYAYRYTVCCSLLDPAQKLAGGIDPNRALNEQQEKSAEQDDSSGVKTVTVAPPVQSQPQSQTPAAGAGGSYWLQAGAFKEEKSAHDLTGSLALTAGISNVQVVKAGSVWRVRIGPFDNKLEASEVQSQLDNQGIQTTVVR